MGWPHAHAAIGPLLLFTVALKSSFALPHCHAAAPHPLRTKSLPPGQDGPPAPAQAASRPRHPPLLDPTLAAHAAICCMVSMKEVCTPWALRAERAIPPARPGQPGRRAWCAVARWRFRAARRRGTVPCTHAACCPSLLAWLRCGGGRRCGLRWRAAPCSTPAWCATTAAGTAAGRRSLARVWPSQLSAGSCARGL